jgi:tetratricopeptide (TPR) repeat protein
MSNKRISRSRKRELETPDEFITFTGKLLQAAAENRQKIIGAGCAVLMAILVIAGLRYYSIQTEQKAFELFQTGLEKIEKAGASKGNAAVQAEIRSVFESVVNKYPRKKAGKIARILLADITCDAGEYDSAISLYERSLKDFDKDPFYRTIILNGLAHACEQSGDNENAIKYMETVNEGQDLGFKDEALYNLGRMASKTGRKELEIEYYQQILKSHPDSVYADMVREKVGKKASEL